LSVQNCSTAIWHAVCLGVCWPQPLRLTQCTYAWPCMLSIEGSPLQHINLTTHSSRNKCSGGGPQHLDSPAFCLPPL
jgi:hypothetical protein